jgi:hypothetical protein
VAFLTLCAVALAQAPTAKATGTVKSVSENSVVITTDAGQESTITFANSSRIVKAAPGQTDLKNAATMQVPDIQIGDRIFAKGQPGESSGLVASLAIVMKKTDIAQRQQTEREEWRRGIGGIVKSVDVSSGTITLANSMAASGKPILVHVSPQTSILRYAPDSIKFDDARPGTLDQTKPGDQLLARGTKDSAGTNVTAQAIISGSFPYIAGTVISADASKSRVTVMDLATKKPVVVRVSDDSMLRKLPPMVATRMAARLKGGTQESGSGDTSGTGQGGANASSSAPNAGAGQGARNRGTTWPGGEPGGNWRGSNGGGDFQQMLSRMPALSISDLNRGDVVMLVATEGSASSEPTAIKMISGVEPILTASPNGKGASMILSPWNLGGGAGDSASE